MSRIIILSRVVDVLMSYMSCTRDVGLGEPPSNTVVHNLLPAQAATVCSRLRGTGLVGLMFKLAALAVLTYGYGWERTTNIRVVWFIVGNGRSDKLRCAYESWLNIHLHGNEFQQGWIVENEISHEIERPQKFYPDTSTNDRDINS